MTTILFMRIRMCLNLTPTTITFLVVAVNKQTTLANTA
jgi:hypothetical protein